VQILVQICAEYSQLGCILHKFVQEFARTRSQNGVPGTVCGLGAPVTGLEELLWDWKLLNLITCKLKK